MKVGGEADYLAEPRTEEELCEALEFAKKKELSFFVLGRGSNVVFDDEGYRGLVISMLRFGEGEIQWDPEIRELTAPSGVTLHRLSLFCRDQGIGGTEFLSGIPGTVGGAVIMNAGFSRHPGQKNEIGDLIQAVTVLNPQGERLTLKREEIAFGYRRADLGPCIVLKAVLRLWKRKKDEIDREIKANFDYRNKKQDLSRPSAGSIFKNPPGGRSAGRIIEAAGLKGLRVGDAMVSEKHANYIVNVGHATCADIKTLITTIQDKVFYAEKILLETEVKFT